jgi:4-hydroxy-tetrahydrodipicolinate synthase
MQLKGVFTALVTPFDQGKLDSDTYKKLCERQLQSGISGLVPCGTTGETPTLTKEEWEQCIRCAVDVSKKEGERQNKTFPVIAGCGTNATQSTIQNITFAKEFGADAALVVFPYYNKPNTEGLIAHVQAACSVGLPIVLYHVPGRTGQRLSVEVLALLCRIEGVVAIKEATGDVTLGQELLNALVDTDVNILSGDDFTYAALTSMGFSGVISVLSNPAPQLSVDWYEAADQGNISNLRELRKKLLPLTAELFENTNPLPCKALMAEMHLLKNEARLPLSAIPWKGSTDPNSLS